MPSSRRRTRWRDRDELRAAVYDFALAKFRDQKRQEWNPKWGEALCRTYQRREAAHADFRSAVIELRAALQTGARALQRRKLEPSTWAASGFAGKSLHRHGVARRESDCSTELRLLDRRLSRAGAQATALHEWFSDFFGGGVVPPELRRSVPRTFRAYLVDCFFTATTGAGRGLPKGLGDCFVTKDEQGTRRLPGHSELAIVSVLCGQLPSISTEDVKTGVPEAGILKREADALRKARGHVLWGERATAPGSNAMARSGMAYDFSALHREAARGRGPSRRKKT